MATVVLLLLAAVVACGELDFRRLALPTVDAIVVELDGASSALSAECASVNFLFEGERL